MLKMIDCEIKKQKKIFQFFTGALPPHTPILSIIIYGCKTPHTPHPKSKNIRKDHKLT